MKKSGRTVKRYTAKPGQPLFARPPEPSLKDEMTAALDAHLERQNAKRGFFQRNAKRLRESWLVVGLEALGLIGLLFGVGLLVYDLREREAERAARAWQLLTTPAPGNSGKIDALEYLNNEYGCLDIWRLAVKPSREEPFGWQGKKLTVLETTGLYIGLQADADETLCWKDRTALTGIDLSKDTHGEAVFLARVSLLGANLFGTNLSGADLWQVNLSRANLVLANLSGADLDGANLSGAILSRTNLSSAILWGANLSDAYLSIANLSGAALEGVTLNEETSLRGIWAYADDPPQNMPEAIASQLALRQQGEDWDTFVDRMIETRPELGWMEDDKRFDPGF